MTFENRKTTGKHWDKTKEKRDQIHDKDLLDANHPEVIEKAKPIEKENDTNDDNDKTVG